MEDNKFKNKFKRINHGVLGFLLWQSTKILKKNRVSFDFEINQKNFKLQQDSIVHVNHSTFILQLSDLVILTDPIWSDYCSPVQGVGYKRRHKPGVIRKSISKVDIILISHNHYDHLDKDTLIYFINKFQPLILVPKGDLKYIKSLGSTNVKEFDWWETYMVKGVTLTFTPAQHYSGRNVHDFNSSLWGGWILKDKERCVYFAGDTGFSLHFEEIRKFCKNKIDISLLPIGAFLPRWYMKDVHLSPSDAVKAHILLNSKKSIGMHYATFDLADDDTVDALTELEVSKKINNISRDDFVVLDFGVSFNI